MACTQLLTGITRDCLPSKGGIRKVWVANVADIDSISFLGTVIDGITMKTGKTFKVYDFARNTASLSSNYQVSAENGTRYVQSDLVLVFNRMDTNKRKEILALLGAELVIFVEDNNGEKWSLGVERKSAGGFSYIGDFSRPVVGADSDADGLTGTAYGDRNGYSITFHWASPDMPYNCLATPPTS